MPFLTIPITSLTLFILGHILPLPSLQTLAGKLHAYCLCTYFVTTVFSTVGFGDMSATNSIERYPYHSSRASDLASSLSASLFSLITPSLCMYVRLHSHFRCRCHVCQHKFGDLACIRNSVEND